MLLTPPGRRADGPRRAVGPHAAWLACRAVLIVAVRRAPVQRVADRTIDFLVGHRPADTRARHCAKPSYTALEAAVRLIPPINIKPPDAARSNVLAWPWSR